MQQAGRPSEGDQAYEDEDKYDNIGLEISCRDKNEQKPSVLGGGEASLVARCRLHEAADIVYCHATFRFCMWTEVHAHTDTLPYPVTWGWDECAHYLKIYDM